MTVWRFIRRADSNRTSVGMADGARRRLLAPRILIVTVVLIAFLHGANALFVYHFYSTTAASEAAARDATATMLAEQASQTFSAIDSALAAAAARLEAGLAKAPLGPADQAILTEEGVRSPAVRTLLVLNRDGTVALDSAGYPPAPRTPAEQQYLAELATDSASGLFIGDLAAGSSAVPYFGMGRAITNASGARVGSVTAVVEPSFFAAMPGTLPNTTALLVHESDGTILAGTGIRTDTTVNQALARYAHDILAIREVDGFPLQLIVAGPPVWMSPAFRNFLIFDSGIMVIVTVVAFWLAWRLAAEERARSTAEIRLHDAIESTPGGFALYDADDRLVLCNRTYVEYYTPPVQPLVVPGARFETIIRQVAETGGWADANDEKTREALIEQRVRAHRQATTELVQRLSDGRWLLTRERRAADGGTACFYTDITRLKQQEEAIRRSERLERQAREIAERADRTKSSFLANMSHELRTPLNAVIGFSQIIEQGMFGPQPARYREYATLIRRSGEHLLTIINDILDIAKLQSGKTELRLEAAVLAPVIDEAVRLVAPRAETARLKLVQDIAPDLPAVRVDLTRIRQVLLNLLSNAIKFTPAGGTVTVTAKAWEGAVEIAVHDTGIGMAEADIPKALEPFGQISNAMTRAHEGTGLGLPLSKSLVELHGGQFSIASTPGRGTTVTVTLPAMASVGEGDHAAPWRGVG